MSLKPSDLHVVTVISNTKRYRSRYTLYNWFKQIMEEAGVTFWTCEMAFGDRAFEVTSPDNPHHLQLRSYHELWHKENMANLMVERLPQNWEYMALIDADVDFSRPNVGHDSWVMETLHQLQHYMVVQMWKDAVDLGPNYEHLHHHTGMIWRYLQGLPLGNAYGQGHPGFAWAWRREAFDAVGGFIDTAILGAADRHMGYALIGRGPESVPANMNYGYLDEIRRWQDRAEKNIMRDVGFVNQGLTHRWHGKKKDRRYHDRWRILIDNDYTPNLDLMKDWQGLLQLTDRNWRLRDQVRAYFSARNEDSTDVE